MNHISTASVFVLIVCLAFITPSLSLFNEENTQSNYFAEKILSDKPKADSNQCFCELNDGVDDCECKIESIDKFNNYKIFPRIRTLMQNDYFRYIKVNLNKKCEFWPPNDGKCAQKDCQVEMCSEEDLPQDFKTYFNNDQNHSSQEETDEEEQECEESNPLGHLNSTLSDENLDAFNKLEKFDDAQYNFCEPDEESLEEAEFADLVDNPERYTSYKGFNYKGLNLILGKNQEKNFVVFGYFAFTGIPIFSE